MKNIDWNEIWKEEQNCNIASGSGRECWYAWNDEADAKDYLAMSKNRLASQDRAEDLCSVVKPDWRVLDIGAGPGNIAIPLSKKTAHVTAVEPAVGMASVLKEQIDFLNIKNIRLIPKRWDDIDPSFDLTPPYELSFASFSLGMLDLKASIKKMIAVTSKEIVLFWHAGPQAWDLDSLVLWPLLHGREFTPIPKSDVVFNLLYSLGIYPDVKVLRYQSEFVYDSVDEALEQYAKRYKATDETKRALLKDYLNTKLISRDEKKIYLRFNVGMRISWNVENYYE